jgi:putative glutamine amidotransferase
MAAKRPDPDPLGTIPGSRPPISSPPLIGVVTHDLRADAQPAWALARGRQERDLAPQRLTLRLTYTQAVQEAGGLAVVVPAHGFVDDTAALLDRLDGLLFSGGPDLDPAVYGQGRHPQLGPDVDRVSDEYELALLAGAAERDLPVLGICRGMQALNVSRGGTLHQHLPDRTGLEHVQGHASYEPAHAVAVERGSLLHRLTRAAGLEVNSHHHQAIDRVLRSRWWPERGRARRSGPSFALLRVQLAGRAAVRRVPIDAPAAPPSMRAPETNRTNGRVSIPSPPPVSATATGAGLFTAGAKSPLAAFFE